MREDGHTGSINLDVANPGVVEPLKRAGKFTIPFAKRGLKVYGIDKSENMLEKAKETDKNNLVNWHKGNILDLPFKNNYFDVCFQAMVIMHIDDKINFFEEIKRVLKSSGICFIRMASHEQMKNLDWYKFFSELFEKDLEVCPDVKKVKEFMKKAGLNCIKEIEIVEKNQTSPFTRLEQVKQKVFSGLRTLTKERYREGLKEYKEYVNNLENPKRKEDNKLMLLTGKKKRE